MTKKSETTNLDITINGVEFQPIDKFAKLLDIKVSEFKEIETHVVDGVKYGNVEQMISFSGFVLVKDAANIVGTTAQAINGMVANGKVLAITVGKFRHVNINEVRQVFAERLIANREKLQKLEQMQRTLLELSLNVSDSNAETIEVDAAIEISEG